MSFKSVTLAAVAALTLGLPALAGDIMIQDAYARSSGASAKSGAAFMVILNHGDTDDRLISVHSDIARKVETHTHLMTENGVMLLYSESYLLQACIPTILPFFLSDLLG